MSVGLHYIMSGLQQLLVPATGYRWASGGFWGLLGDVHVGLLLDPRGLHPSFPTASGPNINVSRSSRRVIKKRNDDPSVSQRAGAAVGSSHFSSEASPADGGDLGGATGKTKPSYTHSRCVLE